MFGGVVVEDFTHKIIIILGYFFAMLFVSLPTSFFSTNHYGAGTHPQIHPPSLIAKSISMLKALYV